MFVTSLAFGIALGFVYGLFFVLQQKRAFSSSIIVHNRYKFIIATLFFFSMRIMIFIVSLFYILHSSSINLILVLMSFVITVLIVILSKGMYPYERC